MRCPCLAAALLVLVATSPLAEADVLGRLLAAADDQTGGAAPAPANDLAQWAGESRATSLPELLKTTVEKSPALASARIDVAIAEARIQQTWQRHDWLVGARLDVVRSTTPQQGTTTSIGASADLSRLLPTGGTIALHADSGYFKTTGSFMGVLDTDGWVDNVTAALTQPLLRNRGRALYDADERRLTIAKDATVLAQRLAAIKAVQAVIAAYWDLVLAERGVAITRASLDLARERLRVTQIGADGGKIPRSEIPAVLQIIATREEDVLNGELTVLDRSIALRRAAGMPIGAGELGLRVSTELDAKDDPLDLGQLVERAYQASPELAQLAKQDASAAIDVEVAENGLLPQLDAALSIGPSGNAGSFASSWKDLVELNTLAINGSLTFSQSLSRDLAKGRIREAQENRRKLTVTAADVRAQLAQGMTTAVAQLELARRRVVLSQRAIDLANENIKIETDRFNLGKSTNFDVLNRQEDLRQAELRKTQALIDGHKAETSVQALTGDILPSYGIRM
jgi:outer membrane protein TolC